MKQSERRDERLQTKQSKRRTRVPLKSFLFFLLANIRRIRSHNRWQAVTQKKSYHFPRSSLVIAPRQTSAVSTLRRCPRLPRTALPGRSTETRDRGKLHFSVNIINSLPPGGHAWIRNIALHCTAHNIYIYSPNKLCSVFSPWWGLSLPSSPCLTSYAPRPLCMHALGLKNYNIILLWIWLYLDVLQLLGIVSDGAAAAAAPSTYEPNVGLCIAMRAVAA